jgi:hypothetical protein
MPYTPPETSPTRSRTRTLHERLPASPDTGGGAADNAQRPHVAAERPFAGHHHDSAHHEEDSEDDHYALNPAHLGSTVKGSSRLSSAAASLQGSSDNAWDDEPSQAAEESLSGTGPMRGRLTRMEGALRAGSVAARALDAALHGS